MLKNIAFLKPPDGFFNQILDQISDPNFVNELESSSAKILASEMRDDKKECCPEVKTQGSV